MANFLVPLLTGIARRAKANFVQKTSQTDAVQEQFLRNLLQTYQNTELGRQYRLSEIKTIEQFRDRIPILPYSSYEPLTERIFQGESNILTCDPVVYINLSSGSTGSKKLIPVTKRFQNSLRKANLTSIGFLADALKARDLKFGKLLLTNSVQIYGHSPGGIEYGAASVGVLRMGKFLYKQIFAHPFETLLPVDSLARHYVCLLFALRNRSMRGIIANFPMLLLRTCDYLERYAEDLIQDLEKGTISPLLELEPAVLSQLEKQWSADPVRARELREILDSEGRLTPQARKSG